MGFMGSSFMGLILTIYDTRASLRDADVSLSKPSPCTLGL